MAALSAEGVDVRPFFFPLSAIPAYRDTPQAGQARKRNKIAYSVTPFGINLPSALNLTQADTEYVAERVRAAVANGKR